MSDVEEDSGANPKAAPSPDLEFRRYEARIGLWKVVLGTGVVGLLGVLIPGIISFYGAVAQSSRERAEAALAKEVAHEQYIKEFFTTAINQDVELRIRFATYFARLAGTDQQPLWQSYLDDLLKQRAEIREQVGDLERQRFALIDADGTVSDTIKYEELSRKLEWATSEVGYLPINRSVVKPPASKKERLYAEALAVVQRLAAQLTKLDSKTSDYVRSWELYRKDLIGVESQVFASTMIQIGIELSDLSSREAPPNDNLKNLAEVLAIVARKELLTDPQPPAVTADAPQSAVQAPAPESAAQ